MPGRVAESWRDFLMRLASLMFGLFLFSLGLVANLQSGLGMSSWGVLNVGLAKVTPLSLGQASQVIGLIVLVIGWALGFAPGFGTLANMFFVGLFIDLNMSWNLIVPSTNLIHQFLTLFLSIALIGVGSLFYLKPRLGAGPRDGLMMGLVRRYDRPVSTVRGVIEVTVLIIGYLLGGPVGIGTVINAFGLGYSVQLAFRIGKYDRKSEHLDLLELINNLSGKATGD